MRSVSIWSAIDVFMALDVMLVLSVARRNAAREIRRIESVRAGQDTTPVSLLVTSTEADQRRSGFRRQARELPDSADALRSELVRRYGRLSETQEKRVQRLYDRAREPDSLSRAAGAAPMPDGSKLELCEACDLTCGAGRQQCREIRAEIEKYGTK